MGSAIIAGIFVILLILRHYNGISTSHQVRDVIIFLLFLYKGEAIENETEQSTTTTR